MIRGLHHVAISTPSIDGLLPFYRDLIGLKEVMHFEWQRGSTDIDELVGLRDSAARQVMLRGNNFCIELFEYTDPCPEPMAPDRPVCNHGHTHICFDVVDIYAVYERLLAAGVTFMAAPKDFGDIRSAYGRDPDGNVFEIQELMNPEDASQLFPFDQGR